MVLNMLIKNETRIYAAPAVKGLTTFKLHSQQNTKHLYNICTKSVQHCINVIQMSYVCLVEINITPLIAKSINVFLFCKV